MVQFVTYDSIVFKALRYLKENLHHKYSSCRHYHIGWMQLKAFMDDNHLTMINPLVCQQYVGHLADLAKIRKLSPKEIRSVKSVTVLSEFITTGMIEQRRAYKFLEGNIGQLIQEYILSKASQRLRNITIRQNERNLSRFNFWLAMEHIGEIDQLRHEHIIRFIQSLDSSKPGYVHLMLTHLKGFLKYLFEQGKIAYNISASVPRDHYRTMRRLPSYYSEDEIERMLLHVDRGTLLGKRDYAIILMTVRLGMRASDVAALSFDNLDWNTNIITFQQRKGGADTKLPLLPVIGNAILDYLQCARPISVLKRVFLIHREPYLPIGPSTVGGIVRRRLLNAGIEIERRKSGSHSMRHSLVKRLLDRNESLPVISEILGHRSQESTRHYIRIDLSALRKCTLSVPPVADGFYSQDGRNTFNPTNVSAWV